MSRLRRLTWGVVGLNVGVILLGALVRATGSGAGCGRSWPVCQGELVPSLEGATLIEFVHRVASGVALVAVLVLAIVVWRATGPGAPARPAAALSVAAIVLEALIGAAIVGFEWVGVDRSVARTVAVPLHLVNTLFLLAVLSVTAAALGSSPLRRPPSWAIWGGAGLVAVAATGAVTALADTLFPATNLAGGLAADWSSAEHFLTRLRVVHPVVALSVSGGIAAMAVRRRASGPARAVLVLVVAQVLAGAANVVLLTPLGMQLVHLAIADGLWIAWVLLAVRPSASSDLGDHQRVAARLG